MIGRTQRTTGSTVSMEHLEGEDCWVVLTTPSSVPCQRTSPGRAYRASLRGLTASGTRSAAPEDAAWLALGPDQRVVWVRVWRQVVFPATDADKDPFASWAQVRNSGTPGGFEAAFGTCHSTF
jgi:hypothetical protein